MRTFKVVMRGPSALVFQERNGLRIDGFPTAAGPVSIVYTSRWINNSEGVRIPGDVWIEVSGHGENLDEVLTRFANAGISVLPVLSLTFNAAIHEPDIEIGFESTAGAQEREYFQSYLSPERTIAHVSRLARADLALSVAQAVFKHLDAQRLLRAANQYRLALESWKLGRESLSIAHLWMAIEALTKVQMRESMAETGATTPQDLAERLCVNLKQLDATLRRDHILNGNGDCYKRAKEASDGFEHGFLGYDPRARGIHPPRSRQACACKHSSSRERCGSNAGSVASNAIRQAGWVLAAGEVSAGGTCRELGTARGHGKRIPVHQMESHSDGMHRVRRRDQDDHQRDIHCRTCGRYRIQPAVL